MVLEDIFEFTSFISFFVSSRRMCAAQVRVGVEVVVVEKMPVVGTSLACDMSLVMAGWYRLIIDACN